jgi:hypothetical protein
LQLSWLKSIRGQSSRIVVERKFKLGKPLGHIKDIGQRLPAGNDRFTH